MAYELVLWFQVGNAQLGGAKAAIVYDNQIDDYFLMVANDSSASSIYIPGLSIPRKVGQLLISSTQVLNSCRQSWNIYSPCAAICSLFNDCEDEHMQTKHGRLHKVWRLGV